MSTAMVVDDSSAMRMILSGILKRLGFEVCTARDGQDALDRIEKDRPPLDFLLVDWNMPVLNGLEFVKRLRAMPTYAPSAVMMVTTETEVDQIVAALDAGANEYVMKPFTPEIIEDKLRIMGVLH